MTLRELTQRLTEELDRFPLLAGLPVVADGHVITDLHWVEDLQGWNLSLEAGAGKYDEWPDW